MKDNNNNIRKEEEEDDREAATDKMIAHLQKLNERSEAYWLKRALNEFPKAGLLYRAKKDMTIFRAIEGNRFLQKDSLSEGEIIMVTWVEDPNAFARKVVSKHNTGEYSSFPAFSYHFLRGEKVWDMSNCLVDRWDESYEEVKTG